MHASPFQKFRVPTETESLLTAMSRRSFLRWMQVWNGANLLTCLYAIFTYLHCESMTVWHNILDFWLKIQRWARVRDRRHKTRRMDVMRINGSWAGENACSIGKRKLKGREKTSSSARVVYLRRAKRIEWPDIYMHPFFFFLQTALGGYEKPS
jgi:hypothetical protein